MGYDLRALLESQVPEGYRFVQDGNRLIAETPFSHLDGDPLEVFVEPKDGIFLLTDLGMTVARLQRQRVPLGTPWRQRAIRTIKTTFGLNGSDEVLEAKANPEQLLDRLSAFISAMTMISALAFRERKEQATSQFPEEVYHFVEERTRRFKPRIIRNWSLEGIDPHGMYAVDVAVVNNGDRRFIYAITNEHRCLTAAIASYFLRYRQHLEFRSLAVFESFEEISAKESARVIGATDVVATNLYREREKIETFLLPFKGRE